jgi:hypothetical protein
MSDHVDEPSDEPQQQPEIILQPEQMAGVWANWALVSHTEHEFTIDFVRMEGTAPPPGRGIVVARVSVSPLFITQFVDALNSNWQTYAEKALPREVYGHDEPAEDDDQDADA